jgi:5,6-dimethylbenzimidazole synthase
MWLTQEEKEGVYKAIFNRRDIRHFRRDPIPEETILRILNAAHHAPSVGYMQPWNFIIIKSDEKKQQIKKVVDKEIQALGMHFEGERAKKFKTIKVEGILEAPVTLCITCDPTREGPHVIGRNSIPETDAYSVVCAIQNLWLAAYAEGLSAGWVSFYKKADIRQILEIPPHIDPIALISLGYPYHYPEKPLLEIIGWSDRYPLENLIFSETWEERYK